ncbi:ABC transporter transmembrane region [Musa troglodytarum]|uniref:ABC transporter transmembrane region n=1 Tax=Musa troglodytarum TaxID=320322 RepID=A0A9E7FU93_9LILI|nr:ABC transporter transmembrane region [Musa troglodytarum]
MPRHLSLVCFLLPLRRTMEFVCPNNPTDVRVDHLKLALNDGSGRLDGYILALSLGFTSIFKILRFAVKKIGPDLLGIGVALFLLYTQVFTCVALFNTLISPLNSFPWVINGLIDAIISTRRLSRFLSCPEKSSEIKRASIWELQGHDPPPCFLRNLTCSKEHAAILFKDASSVWSSSSKVEKSTVLNNISVEIPSGLFVAVIGEAISAADMILIMDKGHIKWVGNLSSFMESPHSKISLPKDSDFSSLQLLLKESKGSASDEIMFMPSVDNELIDASVDASKSADMEELRKEGRVEVAVYKSYARFASWPVVILICISASFMQASRNGNDLWLSHWVDATTGTEHTRFYLLVLSIFGFMNSLFTLARAFSFSYGGLCAAVQVGLALSYAAPIVSLLSSFLTSFTETEKEMVSVERVVEYMDIPQERLQASQALVPDWPMQGQIEFEHVTLRYKPSLPAALHDLSFSIASGMQVGIVGRTGAGKSSILNALFRLTPICNGHILVDGLDIADIAARELRGRFAVVPQSPFLFEGSLRENLDPSCMTPDFKIWEALEKCHIKEEVETAGGLDIIVKENGTSFSVGQRQLICLARAIIKSSKVEQGNPQDLLEDECSRFSSFVKASTM